MDELSCVTGRFQPVHDQHLELFDYALDRSRHLIIAITNPDPGARYESPASTHRHRDGDNPFTFYERARFLQIVLAARGLLERTTIVPFDLNTPERWVEYVPEYARQYVRVYSDWEATKVRLLEAAGYDVTALTGDPDTRLSSSDIRARFAGEDWEGLVPQPLVLELRRHRARWQALRANRGER